VDVLQYVLALVRQSLRQAREGEHELPSGGVEPRLPHGRLLLPGLSAAPLFVGVVGTGGLLLSEEGRSSRRRRRRGRSGRLVVGAAAQHRRAMGRRECIATAIAPYHRG
jgi:hypothetical protein